MNCCVFISQNCDLSEVFSEECDSRVSIFGTHAGWQKAIASYNPDQENLQKHLKMLNMCRSGDVEALVIIAYTLSWTLICRRCKQEVEHMQVERWKVVITSKGLRKSNPFKDKCYTILYQVTFSLWCILKFNHWKFKDFKITRFAF